MAFKTATVQTGKVVSTQSNFPVYVDLDRLGITTLAEANSVRVYADSAKTTEWAREIVSATEMHVKVPSLTSTVEIFVDWDGVRADYAVGATYGRNAVWTDYLAVYHFENTNWTDSTGNGNDLSASASAPTIVAGKIGNAVNFVKASRQSLSTAGLAFSGARSWQLWAEHDVLNDDGCMVGLGNLGGSPRADTPGAVTGVYKQYTATFNGSQVTGYQNGADATTNRVAGSNSYGIGMRDQSSLGIVMDINTNTGSVLAFGGRPNNLTQLNFDGKIDESRMKNGALSANWITTEYNNQNDEATFWGPWTDAGGGGGGGAAQTARRGVIMMM